MGNFRSGGRSGGFGGGRPGGSRFGGKSSGNRFSGGRDFNRGERKPSMHDATCGKCGKPCQVPFKPFGGKPVFCRECFGGNESPRNNFTAPAGSASGASSEQLAQIDAKLDKILLILSDLELDVDEDAEDQRE